MEITERITKDHKYDRGSLKVTLDGRDVTDICQEADPNEGWVELLIVLPNKVNNPFFCHKYLVNDNGAVTHKAHGEIKVTGEWNSCAINNAQPVPAV